MFGVIGTAAVFYDIKSVIVFYAYGAVLAGFIWMIPKNGIKVRDYTLDECEKFVMSIFVFAGLLMVAGECGQEVGNDDKIF